MKRIVPAFVTRFTAKWPEKRLRLLDADLDDTLKASPVWAVHDDLLQSVPGVGPQTARMLLAFLPELGMVSDRVIARLAGLAPLAHDSGQ